MDDKNQHIKFGDDLKNHVRFERDSGPVSVFSNGNFYVLNENWFHQYLSGTTTDAPNNSLSVSVNVGEEFTKVMIDQDENFWTIRGAQGTNGTGDLRLRKYDKDFNLLIDKTPIVNYDNILPFTIALTPEGGLVTIVNISLNGFGTFKVYKFDANGDLLWADGVNSIGNTDYFWGMEVAVDQEGNVYTGYGPRSTNIARFAKFNGVSGILEFTIQLNAATEKEGDAVVLDNQAKYGYLTTKNSLVTTLYKIDLVSETVVGTATFNGVSGSNAIGRRQLDITYDGSRLYLTFIDDIWVVDTETMTAQLFVENVITFRGLYVDSGENIYAVSTTDSIIYKFDKNGTLLFNFDPVGIGGQYPIAHPGKKSILPIIEF